ncbi:hypothetical protein ES702_05369 [subsurface metagenome]
MDLQDHITEGQGSVAEDWVIQHISPSDEFLWMRKTIAISNLINKERAVGILDVGCGTGYVLFNILETGHKISFGSGIDIAFPFVKKAIFFCKRNWCTFLLYR